MPASKTRSINLTKRTQPSPSALSARTSSAAEEATIVLKPDQIQLSWSLAWLNRATLPWLERGRSAPAEDIRRNSFCPGLLKIYQRMMIDTREPIGSIYTYAT